jgi:hypothetical protein
LIERSFGSGVAQKQTGYIDLLVDCQAGFGIDEEICGEAEEADRDEQQGKLPKLRQSGKSSNYEPRGGGFHAVSLGRGTRFRPIIHDRHCEPELLRQ